MDKAKDSKVPFQWTNLFNQYYATFVGNLIMLGHGLIVGSLAPALAILSSENTPLSTGPLSNEEMSWIGSINCLGGLCGSILFGYIAAVIGCKRSLFFVSFTTATFWVLTYFGTVYSQIFVARFISGLSGGGIQTCSILYISEIANDDIRGRLGSVTLVMRNFAILIAYILGGSIDYFLMPIVCISVPLIFMVLFFMLPNTPQYLLQKGNFKKAEAALKYYKGYKGKSDEENRALYKEFDRLKSVSTGQKNGNKLRVSDFCNRSALKGLGIGFALCTIVQFSPSLIIISYALLIFQKAGTTIDPYVSSIVSAVALICGSLITTYLADKLGRKWLNLLSLVGSAVGLFVISFYYYLHINGYELSAFAWVPVVSISFVIFVSSAGITPLCIICAIEFLPTKIRTIGSAMISVVHSFMSFIALKLFPILLEIVALHGCMTILAVGCIVGSLFIAFAMKETAGQSLDDDVDTNEKLKMESIHVEPLLKTEKQNLEQK